jgi:tetratricopeptide (TPR) repeat protein
MYFVKKFYLLLICLSISSALLQGCSVITENPVSALLREAKDFEYEGKFQQAEDAYNKLLNLNGKEASPMRLAILINQGRFYLRTKDYNKAIIVCQDGINECAAIYGSNDTLNASFLFVLASAYDQLGEYDKAIDLYKRIIALGQYSPCTQQYVALLPLVKLGDIEFKRGNPYKALAFYNNAYVIGQLSEVITRLISYRLALCSIALGHYDQAAIYFKNSLPHTTGQSAPKDIYDRYAKFLAKSGKSADIALSQKGFEEWYPKHKEYLDWYYPRTNSGSRFRLVDICTERDYDLVDAIQQHAKSPTNQLDYK